jgi:hypothetical protein
MYRRGAIDMMRYDARIPDDRVLLQSDARQCRR